MNFVFWNIDDQPIGDLLGRLVAENRVDVVCLAENSIDPAVVIRSLNAATLQTFRCPDSETPKIHVFCNAVDADLSEVYADISGRLTIRRLRFDGVKFLLVVTHLLDRLTSTSEDRFAFSQELGSQIRATEKSHRNNRTLVCGDLNMNPFESGIVNALGLHGTPCRVIAEKGGRTVAGTKYPFFYNPMWGFFGDRTEGPPGTHFYRRGHVSHDWNLYDQVLFRPESLPWFPGNIRIITQIGDTSLQMKSGRPNRRIASDHFPVFFELVSRGQNVSK